MTRPAAPYAKYTDYYEAIMRTLSRCLFVTLFLFSSLVLAVPQIQHWTTTNGARVYFVPAPELPIVDIQVVFDAGSAKDGPDSGLAQLTNGLLNEGAGTLDADQIAARFEDLGAEFGSDAERDMAEVSLRSLVEPALLDPAVDTLALVLTQPTFPKDAFERERKRTLVALLAQQQDPGAIASQAFFAAVYSQHPYGSLPLGTEKTLQGLGIADLRAFHRRYYVGRNAVVAIVGDVDRQQAEKLAERVVGRLPPGERAITVPPVPPLSAAREKRTNYPSAQTHVLIGQPGLSRDDQDYFPLYVGNHILGGSGLVSRINDEIREKRGLSYSA
jgi:zinc protease